MQLGTEIWHFCQTHFMHTFNLFHGMKVTIHKSKDAAYKYSSTKLAVLSMQIWLNKISPHTRAFFGYYALFRSFTVTISSSLYINAAQKLLA